MRASSLLLFILTAAKYTFTGVNAGPSKLVSSTVMCQAPEPKNNAKTPDRLESRFRMQCIDGYVRQAGTSNLFKCEKTGNSYLWVNEPSLKCIPDPSKPMSTAANPSTVSATGPTSTAVTNTQAHTPAPNLTLSTSSTTVTSYCTTKDKTQSTSTTSGQTALTTTTPHTVAPTTGTVLHTTTTKETTTNGITLSSSSTLTSRENLTTVFPQFTHSSINTTTTEVNGGITAKISNSTKNGIAAGTVLTLTVITASAVGVFLWCRRRRVDRNRVQMTILSPGSDKPFLDTPASMSSCCSDSVQNPDTPSSHIIQHA